MKRTAMIMPIAHQRGGAEALFDAPSTRKRDQVDG